MAEEIIDLLVKYQALKVISRTSSFQFKGHNEDLRTIGAKLRVAYVLEGSVRRSGDHLRVTAQLINAQDGAHLWSQTYDQDLSEVLKMQDEIAAQVALALQIELNNAMVSKSGPRSTEAYTLLLRGMHAFSRADQQGFEQATNYFQRALDLDPTFADAAVGMAAAYDSLGESNYMPAAAAFEQARRAAQQAIRLDPNDALAHALLGNIHLLYDWDWTAADAEIRQARDLAPNDADILLVAAQHSRILGRWDEALKLTNASVELDPLDPTGHEILNFVQIGGGRLSEAEAAIRRTLEISPTFSFAHYSLAVVLVARGQGETALKEFLKEPDERTRFIGAAIAKFALGAKPDADKALAQWTKSAANDFPYSTATIYAFRNQPDEAFKWLDRAYTQKDARLPFIKGESLMKKLEGDPRYKAFLKKMHLPE
jgi:tetratricopeptide (TPR) repeat protein